LKGMNAMLKRWISVVNVVSAVVLLTFGCAILEKPGKPEFTLRVNCAAFEPCTDNAGNVWLPDQYMEQDNDWGAVDGMTIDRGDLGMTGTDAPEIYETERYSMTAYKFKLPNGKYTVRLHFAETFEGIYGENERVFSVSINNEQVLEDFDPYRVAGGPLKPVVKEFKGVAVTDGMLVIGFEPNIENPEINGIEILSE
jgi:endoglucanase